ncbi:membrane fusion protein, adhesin transport system [Sphingomonas guangdongensis]|uniref:Membrane fusion protein, adhesin transport system n=1 Tax=Sphingomonas guangdongensis TaxID=1141890 RepID=A0A285QYC2_9SPHN|nr:HlyD family efflux transporter periplasmic adaptor subunit [Sphingomonas guangdongensis]SOB86826.1 membrane fusion protein, adhesin transport system [Sphingomonas guangdongensis]
MTLSKPRPAALIVLLTAGLIIGFIAWSLWARLDQITRAPGQVIPSGRVQLIQSTNGGEIARILVREGDKVRRGQLLMTLNPTQVTAGVDEVRARVAALKSTRARVEAELFGRPLAFPADTRGFPEFVANERSLFARRRGALADQLAALGRMESLSRQELALNYPLVKSGDVSRSEVLRMERAVSDLSSQRVNVRNKYIQDLQAEYTKVNEELVSAEQQLVQRGEVLNATELRSPVDGIVKNVRLTTVGGVLRAGDEAMQIVPTGDALLVEAKVPPADIAFIRSGQSAAVRFDAYDSSIYGVGEGRVTFISPDTISEPASAPNMPASVYYRVHLSVATRTMRVPNPGDRIELQPGMTATAEIKTGEHTVFRYLTKPLLKTVGESMGER